MVNTVINIRKKTYLHSYIIPIPILRRLFLVDSTYAIESIPRNKTVT